MKWTKVFLNEFYAKSAAQFLRYACYVIMVILFLSLVLSCIGRQTFILHSHTGTYERAIFAEEDHAPNSRGLTVSVKDDIHVWTDENDEIDILTQIGIFLMFALNTIPLIFGYCLLSRVFSNVQQGKIFTEDNAPYLLGYGLIQVFVAFFVPFIKLFLCWLTSLVSGSRLSIATGQDTLNTLIPSIAFLVAAYIIHYGIHLQDEVDHTL